MKPNPNILLLVFALVAIGGIILWLESQKAFERPSEEDIAAADIDIPIDTKTRKEKAKELEEAKDITTPDGFININDITISDQIGKKVILVDFWTYSCINCQRTLPYLNAWHEKYSDEGLVIVGVHTPEFEFEKEYENVVQAVEKFKIKYPVVLDNDYSTWRAYKNRYWPRKYLIDIDGFIVYDHIGEGAYGETEEKIQELLRERKERLGEEGDITGGTANPEGTQEVDASQVGTPEIYFGALRNEVLANGTPGKKGIQTFSEPDQLTPNGLYLVGTWNITPEYAETVSKDARIILWYRAKDVYMVAHAENEALADVFIDGEKENSFTAGEEELYTVISSPNYDIRVLEIIIREPGFRAFTFTFG